MTIKNLYLISIFQFLIFSCNNGTSQYYEKGKSLYDEGNYTKAIELLTKDIDLNGGTDLAYYYRGRALQSTQKYQKAILNFNKAIAINEDLIYIHVNKAVTQIKLKQHDSALQGLNYIITKFEPSQDSNINRNLAIAYNNRGLIKHQILKDFPNALADFNKSLSFEENSESQLPFMNRGVLFLETKEYEKAITDLERAIQLNDKKAWAHFMKARAHFQIKNYSNSLISINRAIELEATNWRYFNLRGMTLNNLERYNEALSDFNKAVDISNHDYAYNNRGFTKYKLGNLKEALEDCQKAMELNNENSWTFYNLGLINYEIGNKSKACDYFKKALDLGKKEAEIELVNKCQ
ncbi:hypothetical protein BUL40_08770 [Croceivirga radicis]|uniref:Uncharacterized protein n=1 Tax=Croceivirga radicis TaxID=1929488 RepID=A0A1V6LSN7_9FLAO|nr:tetratricopeptide repeat protein [Croceivirga radicis]OQD43168.1 hypothetical protein BUL40_08770 [Croceivirga radicis]